MKLSISNIAWEPAEDELISDLLSELGVSEIDVAPTKYFPQLAVAPHGDIVSLRGQWLARGIHIVGMQSLMFGTQGLNLFGSAEVQAAMLQHLGTVCRFGELLGATKLVFGSPKNRDRMALSDDEANQVAISFFRKLGDVARSFGVLICLEPNPKCYGSNFMTTTEETARVVLMVNHSHIKMQFDTGAITVSGEDPEFILNEYGSIIGHIHLSEPNLLLLGTGPTDHIRIAAAIRKYLPNVVSTIEMAASKEVPHEVAIRSAIGVARRYYF